MFFRFSEKYEKMHRWKIPNGNFALIDGEVVQYSQATQDREPPGNWKDMKFLGKGVFHHHGGRNG